MAQAEHTAEDTTTSTTIVASDSFVFDNSMPLKPLPPDLDIDETIMPIANMLSLADVQEYVVREWLKYCDPRTPDQFDKIFPNCRAQIVSRQETLLAQLNVIKKSSGKSAPTAPTSVEPFQIAILLMHDYIFKRVSLTDTLTDAVLMIYLSHGYRAGLYSTLDEEVFPIRRYCYTINPRARIRDIVETIEYIDSHTPAYSVNTDADLSVVGNGIFDFKNKKLLPFTPDLIFTSKAAVEYKDNRTSPVLHNDEDGTDWELHAWIKELSNDDSEVEHVLWQALTALLRPNVPWNKSLWLCNPEGNNGKGTIAQLWRNIIGEENCSSANIELFTREFGLHGIIGKQAVISDENEVGQFNERAANFKAAITGDVLNINRKNQPIISARFRGLIIQCVNGTPKFRDRSDSLYRRLLYIPFLQSFTGAERKYIKTDYIYNKEVLEYALWYALHEMDDYAFDEPAACRALKNDQRLENDPVREFWDDIAEDLTWTLLPSEFVYDLYTAWYNRTHGSLSGQLSRIKLLGELGSLLKRDPDWRYTGTSMKISPKGRMDAPEPLILKYNLINWMNNASTNTEKKALPAVFDLKRQYRGIYRIDRNTMKPMTIQEYSETLHNTPVPELTGDENLDELSS